MIPVLIVVGCGRTPAKPGVSLSEITGDYRGYVEAGLQEAEPISRVVMRTVEFLKITIKQDGTYLAVIDSEKKKAANGRKLDQGTVAIDGKSIVFKTELKLTPADFGDQSFTALGDVRIDPVTDRKYEYRFANGDRIVVFRS